MEGEIVRSEAPLSQRAMLSKELLKVEAEQRTLLGQYVKQQMVEGTDYGKIPGTEKPTLLKPGAEKLLSLFHCSPEFELVRDQCSQDFERGFFKYTFRVIIRGPGGHLLAEGYGSANSREQRYRWRNANRRCPACAKEAIIQGKAEYGGGWVCFKKKGGCGEKFSADDRRITEQPQGRVENEDIADLDNTILKMAKKRALVDGAIALARCSDMFTQDVEDFAGHHDEPQQRVASTQPETSSIPQEEQAVPKKRAQVKKPAALLTLEEAEKKDLSKELVGYDRWKSKAIAELDDTDLGEAWDFGEGRVKELSSHEHPDHWALNGLKNRVLLLSIEYRNREKRAGTFPTSLEAP